MNNGRTTKLFVVLFFSSILVASSPAGPQPTPKPSLTVSVFNDANLPLATLTQAESRASLVLAGAGISVRWLQCSPSSALPVPDQFHVPSPCSSIAFPSHLSVRILSGTRAVSEDTFGQSFLDASGEGAYSNIYFRNLSDSAAAGLLSAPEILGHVIAHELGHLLLGPNSHSPVGIMASPWTRDQLRLAARGALTFSSAEAVQIRSRIAARPILTVQNEENLRGMGRNGDPAFAHVAHAPERQRQDLENDRGRLPRH